ncbi:MAG: glycosyltransferase [Mesorhizobium sp.]
MEEAGITDLLEQIQGEDEGPAKAHLIFQLARAMRKDGRVEDALRAYQARIGLRPDDDERFLSFLESAAILMEIGADASQVLATLHLANQAAPDRAEAWHVASRYCRNLSRFSEGAEYAREGLLRKKPTGKLDIQDWVYDYALQDEYAVNCYWSGDFQGCAQACETILEEGKAPESVRARVSGNLKLANDKIAALKILTPQPSDPPSLQELDELTPWIRSTAEPHKIIRCIHVVWVGDESRRPDNCIETWRQKNPDWEIRVWGNAELRTTNWRNLKHIKSMIAKELNGVADLMRWEILFAQGGFAIDADAICLRPLEDWLFEPDVFAAWENEWTRPGLIAAGYVYARPGNRLIGQIVQDLHARPDMSGGMAWQITGPGRITETVKSIKYRDLTVYPSHYFMPEHLSGAKYTGQGPVFARQLWGSTNKIYDKLATKDISSEMQGVAKKRLA